VCVGGSLSRCCVTQALPDAKQKMKLGGLLNPSALMFFLYNLSQYLWVGSLVAMGYVKWPTRYVTGLVLRISCCFACCSPVCLGHGCRWFVSFAWGVLALVIMLYSWIRVKRSWAPLYYRYQSRRNDLYYMEADTAGSGGTPLINDDYEEEGEDDQLESDGGMTQQKQTIELKPKV
jgi:hypothetical protein